MFEYMVGMVDDDDVVWSSEECEISWDKEKKYYIAGREEEEKSKNKEEPNIFELLLLVIPDWLNIMVPTKINGQENVWLTRQL